jgi:hypothetical protein
VERNKAAIELLIRLFMLVCLVTGLAECQLLKQRGREKRGFFAVAGGSALGTVYWHDKEFKIK